MRGAFRRKVLAAGLLLPLLLVVPGASASAAIEDPAGDTKDADGQPLASGPADIVSAQAELSGNDLAFRYGATRPLDPLTDQGWSSDHSYADFLVDTDGDGQTDYDAEYGVDEGALYVIVRMVEGDDAELCQGQATFEDNQYVAKVDKACFGSPAAFSYLVETSYDADPADDTSPVAYDSAPDDVPTAG